MNILKNRFSSGMTLIELLLVMGIIGILSSTIIVAVNPGRQLAKARDTQRETDVYAILTSIYQYTSENSGDLPDTDGNPSTSDFPTTLTCIGTDVTCFDLAGAGETETIVPDYMAVMPRDPQTGTDANTGYLIMVDANDRLIASASGETKTISVTR
jgi:prepilin-type N-terminal cleavage/methylation domain-containing protein